MAGDIPATYFGVLIAEEGIELCVGIFSKVDNSLLTAIAITPAILPCHLIPRLLAGVGDIYLYSDRLFHALMLIFLPLLV